MPNASRYLQAGYTCHLTHRCHDRRLLLRTIRERNDYRKLYIGYTTNLKQRLTDHFNGKNEATAPRRPLKLIYCEYHLSGNDARRREKYFKTTAGKSAIRRMLRESLASIENT